MLIVEIANPTRSYVMLLWTLVRSSMGDSHENLNGEYALNSIYRNCIFKHPSCYQTMVQVMMMRSCRSPFNMTFNSCLPCRMSPGLG